MLECSIVRPWGVHETVRNDGECPRCGWTAPGPVGDARQDAREALQGALVRAEALGWDVIDGDVDGSPDAALAA
jgi:hypothetical protein